MLRMSGVSDLGGSGGGGGGRGDLVKGPGDELESQHGGPLYQCLLIGGSSLHTMSAIASVFLGLQMRSRKGEAYERHICSPRQKAGRAVGLSAVLTLLHITSTRQSIWIEKCLRGLGMRLGTGLGMSIRDNPTPIRGCATA